MTLKLGSFCETLVLDKETRNFLLNTSKFNKCSLQFLTHLINLLHTKTVKL